jgi:hypothetical protein
MSPWGGPGGRLGQVFLEEGFSLGTHEYRLSNEESQIVVVILGHFSDNGG